MLMQLVVLHIAKEARLARREIIGMSQPIGWQVPVPNYALRASKTVNSIRAADIVSVGPGDPSLSEPDSLSTGWAALGFFLLAVFWVTLRRA